MTAEEIMQFFEEYPEKLNDPSYRKMYDEALPFVQYEKLPEQTRNDYWIHDHYLKLKRDLLLKRGFDDHYDRQGWTKEEYDENLRKFENYLEVEIREFEERNSESLERTHAKKDWERLKHWDLATDSNCKEFQLAPHIPEKYI